MKNNTLGMVFIGLAVIFVILSVGFIVADKYLENSMDRNSVTVPFVP